MQDALAILKRAEGQGAEFREGQEDAISAMLEDGARQLLVQRTGWGKSVVYFVATALRRAKGAGPTLLVSPLLALMRNQIEVAAKYGVRAATINSSNREEWAGAIEGLQVREVDLLLISPERLGNAGFSEDVLAPMLPGLGMLVIDEAHCISDWGHDFRPDYRRILQTVRRLDGKVPILATTATANDRVVADIKEQLGERLVVKRGPLMRDSLRIRVQPKLDQAERLAVLAEMLSRLKGSGIIYALTVNDTRRVAEWLRKCGHDVEAYNADRSPETRVELERRFVANELKALVATTALGMGYDKPDVAFVIHFQRPGSIIAYYQQIGRAGRQLERSEIVLMEGHEDDEIIEHFIENAFPPTECFERILIELRQGSASADALLRKLNFRKSVIDRALSLIEVHDGIERVDRKWILRDRGWSPSRLRADEIVRQRRLEAEQMRDFARSSSCRMEYLARALDDPHAGRCGRCDNCASLASLQAPRNRILEAIAFVRGDVQRIEPKKMYPAGFAADGRKSIPEEERLLSGIALSVYNDAGWGKLVREGKYESGRFSDELIEPCIAAIRRQPIQPDWLTWVPSLKRQELIEDFSLRLAKELGIEAVRSVVKSVQNREQKVMQNSAMQLGNVWPSFEVSEVRGGVCLLIDDIVDSGWTMTAIGIRLRRAGSGPVLPFALASARPRDEV